MVCFSVAIVGMLLQVAGYSDVPPSHWAAKSVTHLVETKMLVPAPGATFQGDQPVTRYEFAVMIDKFITDIRKTFIRQPEKKIINEKKIAGRDVDGSKAAMVRLAKEGFLPYYSPIFMGPKDTLTPQMMSVALSQISTKIASLYRPEISDR